MALILHPIDHPFSIRSVSLAASAWLIILAFSATQSTAQTSDPQGQVQAGTRAAPPSDIQPGAPIASHLDTGRPFENYRLHLDAWDTVRIDMESPTRSSSGNATGDAAADANRFDTYLELRREGGQDPVASDDDGGEGFNSRLIFTAPTTGYYVIRARSFANNAAGDYVLTVTNVSHASPPTVLAEQFKVSVEDDLGATSPTTEIFNRDARYALYWVRAAQGDRMRLQVRSSTAGATLELLDTSGSTLAANIGADPDVQIISVVPQTDRYLVRVAIPSDRIAHYTLEIERAPTRPRGHREIVRTPYNESHELTLASNISPKPDGSGEADFFYKLYFLPVTQDHPVTVLVDASGFDPVVEGGEVDTLGFVSWVSVSSVAGRTARLVLQPFRDGNVYIRVRSTGLAIGTFRIQIMEGAARPPT